MLSKQSLGVGEAEAGADVTATVVNDQAATLHSQVQGFHDTFP